MSPKGRTLLLSCLLATGLSAWLCVQRLNAQVLYGSVVGTVADQTGASVPGAHVTIINPLTGLNRETETDSAGSYSIPNLPEGAYNLTANAKGFKPLKQTNIQVRVGSILRIDMTLEVGAVTQEITVQASAAVLQTEKSDVSTQLGTVAVQNLPTGFYRNYHYPLTLDPWDAAEQG